MTSIYMQAQPALHNIVALTDSVEQYEKFEVSLDLSATYSNPYNYDEVWVYCQLTAPDGTSLTIDGFFMENYDLTNSGKLIPTGNAFNIRFAPNQLGIWSYKIFATDGTGTSSSTPLTFQCIAKTHPKNRGFIRKNQTNYLQFDDGGAYIPVGENMCWHINNPYLDYKKWLDKLSTVGGNYIRLWQAHWGLGIEWKNNWNNFQGLGKYQQSNSKYLDWLFDYCAEKGIYVMLCLQHHGQVSNDVNPNWSDNPYNVANGGPCTNTWDFFSNTTAIALTKNRFRYTLARWGYSRSIMVWELWNEVDWTDNYESHEVEIMQWHAEMAGYLKSIDPYKHLRTTSFAHQDYDPLIWANPDIDFSQTHFYINTGNIERVLSTGISQHLQDYAKPTLTGEFGIGLSSTLGTVDPTGIHIHNGIWGSLFSGALGSAMSWWWDIYIEAENLYYHLWPLSSIIQETPLLEKEMSPVLAKVEGAAGDLTLIPSLGWGAIGEDSIEISPTGQLIPESPSLSSYLYGSMWNTQYRSPPVFTGNFLGGFSFSVTTSSSTSGSNPKIAIYVDGAKVLEQNAATQSTYTVSISAGFHTLKVDNTGKDWISISSYDFEGLGSKLDGYVLAAADKTVAAGWLLNNAYNHQKIANQGLPAPISGAELLISDFAPGSYYAKWYDCLSGNLLSSQQISVVDDTVRLAVPDLLWDMAFLLDAEEVSVAIDPFIEAEGANLYPNPASPGAKLKIEWYEKLASKYVQIDLLNMNGSMVYSLKNEKSSSGLFLKLPEKLTHGMYWVRIREENTVKVLPLLVSY